MARGMIGVASAMVVSTGNLAMALNHLPFLVCLASVVGLCIGFARHRILHRESETDGERMELRYGGEALSSNLRIKRNSFKNSFSFKHSFSRSVSSKQGSLQGNGSSEEVRNEPLALWQKAILRGERCVPLSFSGLVLYDENGNLLPKRNKSFIRD